PFDLANAGQRIAYEAGFGFELRGIAEVLKLAAAAIIKVSAHRRAARGRRFDDGFDDGAGIIFLALDEANAQTLAGCGKPNEDRQAAVTRHRVAAIRQPLSRHFDAVANF